MIGSLEVSKATAASLLAYELTIDGCTECGEPAGSHHHLGCIAQIPRAPDAPLNWVSGRYVLPTATLPKCESCNGTGDPQWYMRRDGGPIGWSPCGGCDGAGYLTGNALIEILVPTASGLDQRVVASARYLAAMPVVRVPPGWSDGHPRLDRWHALIDMNGCVTIAGPARVESWRRAPEHAKFTEGEHALLLIDVRRRG